MPPLDVGHRWASHLSLPDCWIADTGCGYDFISADWVDEVDKKRLTQIDQPPTFAGVGGSMAAKMKDEEPHAQISG